MPRFLKFNGVGAIGFALQLALLALLLRLGLHYLAATALAVELTILHNFAWHERWTWRDRPAAAGGPSTGGPGARSGCGAFMRLTAWCRWPGTSS